MTLTTPQKKRVYFYLLRILAILALVCTAALAIFILVQSSFSGEESAKQFNNTLSIIGGLNPSPSPSSQASPLFVRKMLGHFLLFALLGVGFSFCFLLLSNHKKTYPVFGTFSGFILALFSEMLQLPAFTTGRSASWTDVGIDVAGTLCGIAFSTIVLLLYAVIKKAISKEEYSLVKELTLSLSLKTLLGKWSKTLALSTSEYEKISRNSEA